MRVRARTQDGWNDAIAITLDRYYGVLDIALLWVDFGDGVPRFLREDEYERLEG